MTLRSRLLLASIIMYFVLVFITFYFRFFPIIISTEISDFLLFVSLALFFIILIYGVSRIKSPIESLLFIPQPIILAFLIRALPNLRLSSPPLHDPYFYYVSTLNVVDYGTLSPLLGSWYSQTQMQLNWPANSLLLTSLSQATGIDPMLLMRFQEPIIGAIFFIVVFALSVCLTKRYGLSILAATIASFSEVIIYYQSEYHPQGLAFLLFALLLLSIAIYHERKKMRHGLILLLIILAFITSHHFSSLFLGILAIMYIFVSSMFAKFLGQKQLKVGNNLWLLIAVSSLAYHVMIYISPLKQILGKASETSLYPSVGGASLDAPLYFDILSLGKWVVVMLAGIFAILIFIQFIKQRKSIGPSDLNQFRLLLLGACICCAGFISTFIIASPIQRFVGFIMPIAAIFSVIIIFKMWDRKQLRLIATMILLFPIISGLCLGPFMPSLLWHSSETDDYYWYSNELPSMDEYVTSGHWLGEYTLENAKFETEFDTRMVPFFYAERTDTNIHYGSDAYSYEYIIINPLIDHANSTKYDSINNSGLVYSNMEINVYLQK